MSLLKKIAKDNKFNASIQNVSDQKPTEFISTRCYALNGIFSGNVFNGMPDDTIVALCGKSNSGKSLILAHIIKSALEKNYDVIIFDSERSVRKDYYEKIGCDPSRIFRVPVGSILEFRNVAYKIIEEYYAKATEKDRLFIGVDSLSNLASEKELADCEKDKDASDQGNSAKLQNSAMRVLASLANKYNFPCVFTNHVYASIGDMYAQRDVIAGGAKAIYNSNIILYCERLINKEETEDALGKTVKTDVGIRIKATTVKNRQFVENQTVYLDLRYDSGINIYSGLLQFAIRANVIQNKPRGYLVTATDKTIFDRDLYTPEVFNQAALEKINEWLGKNGYSSLSTIFSDEVAVALGEENGETQGKQRP